MRNEINRIDSLITDLLEGNNWTGINAHQALIDVSAKKAVQRINKQQLNIAELMAHLTCWNEIITLRLDKQDHQPSKKEDFPRISRLTSEKWKDLKLDFFRSFHLLKGRLENKEDSILDEPMFEGASPAYRNLHGQISHVHYHLGQIVLLKKLL